MPELTHTTNTHSHHYQANMQTRAEFLEHGLAPALTSTLSALSEEDRDCTICSETLTNAVQLPCHHIFDQECITHWLEIPGKNTCPFCRRTLFDMTAPEPTMHPQTDRRGSTKQ